MSSGANFFLNKTLGEDFLQSLEKFELWKPGTRTTIDHEEIKTALKIVPRTLMSMLIHNLSSMEIGETKEIEIPINQSGPADAMIRVSKHERDVYSGELLQNNKRIVDFKYRSIPGVGLVIMSALELYDVDNLSKETPGHSADVMDKVQRMIDDRLALHDLIGKVVDKKIAERDAIQKVILSKLTEELHKEKEAAEQARAQLAGAGVAAMGYPVDLEQGDWGHSASLDDVKRLHDEKEDLRKENKKLKKKLALNEFLEERKHKLHKKEYSVSLLKNETVRCPDCGNALIEGKVFTGCICLGDDMDKKIYLTKSEDGVKVRFGKGWDAGNIEMLLEVLRGKRG